MDKRCTVCEYHCNECDRINRVRSGNNHSPNDTLCFCCKNAVPQKDVDGTYIYGCSWSINAKPVEGWSCVEKLYREWAGKLVVSYRVKSCPLFVRG
jgi:hypothetical protein